MQTNFNTALLSYQQVCVVRKLLKATGNTATNLGYPSPEDIPQPEFLGIIDRLSSQAKRGVGAV